jgi:chromosome partitioning protein
MSAPVLAFFNNKGGVGKTSLVYHLAWMFADQDLRVLAADLDPQANLSAAFLDEDRLEELWPDGDHPETILGAVRPLISGAGDIASPHVEEVAERLGLVVGDLALSTFEDQLSSEWPACLDRKERAFRVISALWRILQRAAEQSRAELVLLDLAPSLGAINRACLVAADFVVIPLTPDLYSLQGLKNLGPTFRTWRTDWQERLGKKPSLDFALPAGEMKPLGYVVHQHRARSDRPVRAYERWIDRIPATYRECVLATNPEPELDGSDPYCLAMLKHYSSLMPMAQEARKPIFHLKPADGAIGAHQAAVRDVYFAFKGLAGEIRSRVNVAQQLPLPRG